jgi:hypothetical protein
MKESVTYAQEQEQRETANRGFRKPEVKGSSPFAGSIESSSLSPLQLVGKPSFSRDEAGKITGYVCAFRDRRSIPLGTQSLLTQSRQAFFLFFSPSRLCVLAPLR